MAQDYHNPDESAYDLISRLRKEARGKEQTGYKKVNFVPHPSIRKSGKGKVKSPSLFKTRRFFRIPMSVMGIKLSTLLMGICSILALAIISIGLTIFFTHTPAGSPINPDAESGAADYPDDLYDEETENGDDYYPEDYEEYPPYDDEDEEDYDEEDEPEEDEELENEDNPPPSRQEIAVAIRPHIAGLRSQLELTFGAQEWAGIIEELAQDAYYAYHRLEPGIEEWQAFVIEYAQTMFLESDWVMDIGEAPEEMSETEESTPTPSPTPMPTPTPPPNDTADNQPDEPVEDVPRIIHVTLTTVRGGQTFNMVVPMVYNQTLLDLFILDFNLRLAVNDPSRFPHDEGTMTAWANTLTTLYFNEGQSGAEYRLRRNIAALERAEIEQQYVPWVPPED